MALLDINRIASSIGIGKKHLFQYGPNKAKVDLSIMDELKDRPDGKLVLVTAITPTKAGEGKTTASIALAEGMGKIKQKALLCLREPSMGPVFGLKGGATGGGLATIEPSEDINLHFNGDMHALTSSINLIAAVIDNSIYQGNPMGIDPDRIVWKRALDMNDRALRDTIVARNDKKAIAHEASFVITVASEMMAIMCLAIDEQDFLRRLERIVVAFDKDGKPLTVKDFKVTHAVMRLMKQALNPNLVQTREHNPALVHGGPFANIAHGCNSLLATKMALKLSPIVITEAGFGADLGAEKFLDIASVEGGLHPSMAVVVATIRALKMHGGQPFEELKNPDIEALKKGVCNLDKHMENMAKYGLPTLVAINHFASDSKEEVAWLTKHCEEMGYRHCFLDGFLKGGKGAVEFATMVCDILSTTESHYHPLYDRHEPVKEKTEKIAKQVYGAKGVHYSDLAESKLKLIHELGLDEAYVCMAKTPNSLSDNAKLLGVPTDFEIDVRDIDFAAGANFIIPLCGSILTMPGLPKVPAAVKMEDEPW